MFLPTANSARRRSSSTGDLGVSVGVLLPHLAFRSPWRSGLLLPSLSSALCVFAPSRAFPSFWRSLCTSSRGVVLGVWGPGCASFPNSATPTALGSSSTGPGPTRTPPGCSSCYRLLAGSHRCYPSIRTLGHLRSGAPVKGNAPLSHRRRRHESFATTVPLAPRRGTLASKAEIF